MSIRLDEIKLEESYERGGWPAIPRPDRKPPEGWSLDLVSGWKRLYNHALSPDGSKIAFLSDREGNTDVYVMDARGGWPQRITFNRPAYQYWWEEVPQWAPDSRRLAFTIGSQVYIADLRRGLPKRLLDYAAHCGSPRWFPDGQRLALTLETGDQSHIFLSDVQGSLLRRLTRGEGEYFDPRPSPDGRILACTFTPRSDLNRTEIRLVDLESGAESTLAGKAGVCSRAPRFSPDGQLLAYLSQESGFFEIYLAPSAGGRARRLTHANADLGDIAWSPDGTRLAAIWNDRAALRPVVIDAASGEMRVLGGEDSTWANPQWLPSGDALVCEVCSPIAPPDLQRLSLADGRTRQLTFSAPPALSGAPMVFPTRVSFRSADGLEIPAILYRPERSNRAAVVHPHGGPRGQYGFDFDPFVQYLAAKGYAYLALNYRGGTGYGREFELLNQDAWGIGDTQDCLAAADYLAQSEGLDARRLAIMGGSYGGYMTFCALARDPRHRYACGVSLYGDADIFNSWALCDRSTRLYTEMQLGHPARARQVYLDGSPLHEVENVQAPMLILHGLDDEVVPPQSSHEWVEALRRTGKTFEYKTYAGESHGFLKHENVLDVHRRIERFLDWYLMPE